MGPGKGVYILVYAWINNADREDTTGMVRKYRQLVKRAQQTRVEQTILSGIPLVKRSRESDIKISEGWQLTLCKEQDVEFVRMFCWED